MFTRAQLYTAQQELIDAFPLEYDVVITANQIKITTTAPPHRSLVFREHDKVREFLETPDFDKALAAACWKLEKARIETAITALKFKRDGRFYQRPGAELKLWFFPDCIRVTDMYAKNSKTARTFDELFAILASGEYR